MQIFYNKKVDFIVKRMVPGIAVLGIAGWGAAFGSADIQNVPGLLSLDTVALAEDANAEISAETGEVFTGTYQDGTYQGTAQGWGGTIEVEVTIADGKISAIAVTSASGETAAYLSRAKTLISTMLEKQTASVDTVSGATYSSNGIINAVKAALLKAQTGDTGKDAVTNTGGLGSAIASAASGTTSSVAFTDGTYQDGTYTGSAKGWGGTITVSVTISGGKISAVNVVSASGETAAYFNKAKILTSTVVTKQTPNVDTISGATYSSNGILNAIKAALSKAQSGNGADSGSAEVPSTDAEALSSDSDTNDNSTTADDSFSAASAYKAGIYTGTATVKNFDYDVSLTVYINKLGKIIDIEEADDHDYDGNEAYMKAALTSDSANGKGTILSQLKGTACAALGGLEVDTVSGATYSSNAIVSAVKNAVKQAGTEDSSDSAEETPDTPVTPSDDEQTADDTDKPTESTPTEDEEDTAVSTHPKTNGTYTGTATVIDGMEMFDTGSYDISVAVTTEDGKLTAVQLTSSVDDSNLSYMNRALTGYTRKGVFYNSIPSQFIGMRVEDAASASVDIVSSATYSSNALAEAIKNALA